MHTVFWCTHKTLPCDSDGSEWILNEPDPLFAPVMSWTRQCCWGWAWRRPRLWAWLSPRCSARWPDCRCPSPKSRRRMMFSACAAAALLFCSLWSPLLKRSRRSSRTTTEYPRTMSSEWNCSSCRFYKCSLSFLHQIKDTSTWFQLSVLVSIGYLIAHTHFLDFYI